ncbi:hypothetical protein BDZ97DRAFT_375775 [Flammula alnicola]|nr:hypothetical protein BDZ97DRAFT_375775 [Flammula alnicola]
MTERQIEVWFQNHRTRARKEGKVVEKLDSNSLPKTSLLKRCGVSCRLHLIIVVFQAAVFPIRHLITILLRTTPM